MPDVTTNEVVVHNNTSELLSATITTLSSAVTSTTATSIAVTSVTGFTIGDIIKIGNDYMKISSVGGSSLTVTRNLWGTATTHSNGANITIVHRASWGETFSIPTAQVAVLFLAQLIM